MKRTAKRKEEILTAIERILKPLYRTEHCAGGHDGQHVARMLKIAKRILVPGDVDLFLLKIAIWFHNLDRSRKFTGHEDIFIRRVLETLPFDAFDAGEISLIIDAVEKHSRLNDPSDSVLLRYLKDCDRLDIGAIGILRIAAFRGTKFPIWKPGDFKGKKRSTAENDIVSLVHDIQRCLEWEAMLRTPEARGFGSDRFAFLRFFCDQIKEELEGLDLLPQTKG